MAQISENTPAHEKKVFFLYPHGVVKTELLKFLIMAEYEVALVNDYQKASMLLYRFKSSILFINVESKLNDAEWEKYIRDLMAAKEKHDARIGILTYADRPDLGKKYIEEIGIQCGYIPLNQGIHDTARIILKTLEANQARGQRKYIRIACPFGKGVLNINYRGRRLPGIILDISIVGMACVLKEEIELNQVLDDIQLRLWGVLLKIKAKLVGSRQNTAGRAVFVFIFDPGSKAENQDKIHDFISRVHQNMIDTI